jgi:UDPglucose 6-dehydrogenase
MAHKKVISVIGAGYVGLTTASILAACNYKVYLLDVDKRKIETIKKGKSHFYEEGIENLIKYDLDHKTLIPTLSYKEAVPSSSIIFSCVGTPDNPDGSPNLEYVYAAAKEVGKLAKKTAVFVQKSTVPVGTGKSIIDKFAKHGHKLNYVSNPEFLREGTAIADTVLFDRIVIGGQEKYRNEVAALYEAIEQNRQKIMEIAELELDETIVKNHTGSYIFTSIESAELVKVAANSFLALKISFANSIAKLADKTNADVVEVMKAVGADKRIGTAFLNAGRGYGGGCFPKDVSGLISSANGYGIDLRIIAASAELNDSMPGYIVNKTKEAINGFSQKKVAVLGLSFKVGTSDVRKSPSIAIANLLVKEGAEVTAHDPAVKGKTHDGLSSKVKLGKSYEKAVKKVDAVFIATDWPEYIEMDLKHLAKLMNGKLFIDCMNSFAPELVRSARLEYLGVGR